jgi:NIMA (never in mitosis gene a)-related kinase
VEEAIPSYKPTFSKETTQKVSHFLIDNPSFLRATGIPMKVRRKWEGVRELGKGGQGRVLLVRALDDGKFRVIKEVDVSGMSELREAAALREARMLSSLKHSNIIRYYGHSVTDGKLRILMEYADAGDLARAITTRQNAKWSEETVTDYFVQMCLAVKYIHDRKIVHRDIKPGNFFLTSDKVVKLGDFGLSAFLPSTHAFLKSVLGTAHYLAPEVCCGSKYSQKSDIWSLGCVLYEMCTFKKAFNGYSTRLIMHSIACDDPPKLSSSFGHNIRLLVKRMLSREPEKRPTINQILTLDFIRFKAIALLGRSQARVELAHTIFHGEAPGETPSGAPESVAILTETEQEDEDKIDFMGRTLVLPHLGTDASPQLRAESLRQFIEELIGIVRFREIYNLLASEDTEKVRQELISKTDESVAKLIVRLMALEAR